MSNAIRCIDQRFAFKNSRISCLALIFNLKNPSTTVLYAKKSVAGGEIWRVIYRFFFKLSIWTYGLVVNTGCRESGDMGSIPDDCWNPLPRLGHFAWHWARQCTDTRAFILLRSLIFFLLGFRQWRSRADSVVNLNTTIRLALFWRIWTWAWASTRPHVLAWRIADIIAIVEHWSWLTTRSVAFFPISRKYRKNEGLIRDFF